MEDLYLNSIPKGRYLPIWQQYVPAIMKALEAGGCHEIMVSKELFENVGKRKATGYNFSLEYVACQVNCTLSHLRKHAVKRDLDTALYLDKDFCSFLMFHDVFFWFHDFILQVQCTPSSI